MFVSITLLISTLFFQIILIQFITNQTTVKYKKIALKKEMKVESLKILKDIYKIESSMTSLANDNINSTIAILEKKCMSEYSKMNKCLIMNMQGKEITDNGANIYCKAFTDFMNTIHPNQKILKSDIKSMLMSYGGSVSVVNNGVTTVISSDINVSPLVMKPYGGYVNYLNDDTLFTSQEKIEALDNSTYTAANFIKKTKIAKYMRLKQLLPKTNTTDYKNITFYSLFSVEYGNVGKPIFFQDLKFPMYSDSKRTSNLSKNNKAEFIYGIESYLHMVIPKLKSIYIILENLKRGQYKKLTVEISRNQFKPKEYTENENIYATAYIRFHNTISALGYAGKPLKLFDDYGSPIPASQSANTTGKANSLAKAIAQTTTINFGLLRYNLDYYDFNDINYKVDEYVIDATTTPAITIDINLCDFEKYIKPVKFKLR